MHGDKQIHVKELKLVRNIIRFDLVFKHPLKQHLIKNLEYYFIFFLMIIYAVYHFCLYFGQDISLEHDAYYRIVRAINFDKHGVFNSFESLPWTLPLDICFYYCAKILQFIFNLDFAKA